MFSRRQLRIKVMNSLYAFNNDAYDSLEKAHKALMSQFDNAYHLYLFNIKILYDVVAYSIIDLDNTKSKFTIMV